MDATRMMFGLDIGRSAVKGVLLDTDSGLRLAGTVKTGLPDHSHEDSGAVRPAPVSSAIQTLLAGLPARPSAVTLSIPTETAVVRWIDLPAMGAEELKTATRFEAVKHLPFPVDEAEVVIVPPSAPPGGGRMHALLVAVPKAVVRSRLEAVNLAGLDVSGAEVEIFAVLRAVEAARMPMPDFWHGQSQALVQIGHEMSSVCIASGAQVQFLRAIPWGARRLDDALAASLGCSAAEAAAIKEDPASGVDAQGRFHWGAPGKRREGMALAAELDRLCRETLRLINYYRSMTAETRSEAGLTQIVMSGGLCALDGLADYCTRSLRIRTVTPNLLHPEFSPVSLGLQLPRCSDGASFTTALGLALGGLEAGREGGDGEGEFVWRRDHDREAAIR